MGQCCCSDDGTKIKTKRSRVSSGDASSKPSFPKTGPRWTLRGTGEPGVNKSHALEAGEPESCPAAGETVFENDPIVILLANALR